MLKYFTFIGCLVLLVSGRSDAVQSYQPQSTDPLLDPWRWQAVTELKGVGILSLVEAPDESMWFGTDEGLKRYDGLTWTHFSGDNGLYGTQVQALHVLPDGQIYVGTERGLCLWTGERLIRVFPRSDRLDWSVNHITQLHDGSLLVGTQWGLLKLKGNEVVFYTSQDISDMLRVRDPAFVAHVTVVPHDMAPSNLFETGLGIQMRSGVVWALAHDGPGQQAGVQVGDHILAVNGVPNGTQAELEGPVGTPVELVVQRAGNVDTLLLATGVVNGSYRDFPVYHIYEDRAQTTWVGLQTGEILACRPEQDVWHRYKRNDGLDLGNFPKITQTMDGTIWAISNSLNNRINRFDGHRWNRLDLHPLEGVNINTSLVETPDSTLWIGGHKGILHAIKGDSIRIYTTDETPLQRIRVTHLVHTKGGHLWVGSLTEVYCLDYGTPRVKTYRNLAFQCETNDGRQWFLSIDGNAVVYDGRQWLTYGVEDGLIDAPLYLMHTPQGDLWAGGSHDSTAALARLEGNRWSRKLYPKTSWAFDPNTYLAIDNGDLWFAARGDIFSERGHLGGIMRFEDSVWKQDTSPPISLLYGIGHTDEGYVWIGGLGGLYHFDGKTWAADPEIAQFARSPFDVLYSTPDGDLWAGNRSYGLFHYAQGDWKRYNVRDGIMEGRIRHISQTADGTVWVVSDEGVSRFDGQTWMPHALTEDWLEGGAVTLRQGRKGELWISTVSTNWLERARPIPVSQKGTDYHFQTVRYMPDILAPETHIETTLDQVGQSGNVTILWSGKDHWKTGDLTYSWRLDGGEWSAFGTKTSQDFANLSPGEHRFEVKARNRDFNEDQTPALLMFRIIPPIWQQGWFVGLMVVSAGLIVLQTVRVIRRGKRLRDANKILESQNAQIRQTQAEAEQANRAKSIFLANMSHEIRTPMNAILGYAQILNGASDLPDHLRRSVETIEQSGEHLLALINDVLDISKIEAGREELNAVDFDLQGLVEGLGSMFELRCREKDLTWTFNANIDRLAVHGDEGKLRQVLINLLGNAVKFTDRGGVTLTIDSRADDQVYFEVKDTGPGIAKAQQDAIFEPFQQEDEGVRQGGTGLGLAISLHYVEMMGGAVALKSESGAGACFSFSLVLPAAQAPVSETALSDWADVSYLSEGQVVRALVVDDITTNRDVLAHFLKQVGVIVETASDGGRGLEIVRENMPDIVFMDIHMPGMDGLETLFHLREEHGEQAPIVIAVTASVFEHQQQQYLEAGFKGFLDKPLKEEKVYACLADQLGVTFEFAEPQVEVDAQQDWDEIVVPAELYKKLVSSVEMHSITELRGHIDKLSDLGGEFEALAARLSDLVAELDIEGVQDILEKLKQ